MELVTVSVGIGLVVSLLLSELFGLAAGGMVVPGYFALFLDRPGVIGVTLAAALLTFLIVRWLACYLIVYGKRRVALMMLVGFLLGMLARSVAYGLFDSTGTPGAIQAADFAVVGYIIPGLIALWIDRQGLLETVSVVLLASTMVRLCLILFGAAEGGALVYAGM